MEQRASTTQTGWTRVALETVDDSAARHGFGEDQESRFPAGDLGAERTGAAFHRVRPGRRMSFGHRHEQAEEVYVVIGGSGRAALDDEVIEVTRLDAIRVAPGTARNFEAGPDGLEVLAFGARHAGDGEILPGWWAGQEG